MSCRTCYRTHCHTLLLLASSLAPILVLPASAPAQVQPVQTQQQAPNHTPLNLREGWQNETLEKALGSLRWDTAQRGPLLVVNAGSTRAPSLHYSSPVFGPPLGAAPPSGRSLRQLGEHFARREFAVRTLTVLAPAEMMTLNPKPARPNPFAELSPRDASGLFLASLTPQQMKLVTGKEGIGISDLDQRQRDLFQALLPAKTLVRRTEMQQNEGSNGSPSLSENTINEMPVTEAARMQARFKLQKTLQLSLNPVGRASDFYHFDTRKAGDTFQRLSSPPREAAADVRRRQVAYGVELRQWRSNKLKSGQLAFDAPALNPSVSLEGAATVGDLIKRISAVTHVELHADRRVARLPVWVKGQSARSGDVLEALCLAVTGAFRKVGTAYLLTHDVEGLAVQWARLKEWAIESNMAISNPRQEASDRFGKPDVFDSIPGAAGEYPFPITGEICKQQKDAIPPHNFLHIPLSSLAADVQSTVRDAAGRVSSGNPGTALDQNVVRASEQIIGYFVLPGIGEVSHEDLTGGLVFFRGAPAVPAPNSPPPPTIPPVLLKPEKAPNRALFFSADALASDDAVRQIAEAASRRGLNQLWVSLTPEDDAFAVLTRAVAAGKRAGLAVWASPRLLHPPRNVPDEHRDRSLMGTTTAVPPALSSPPMPPDVAAPEEGIEWRRIDLPEATTAVKSWLGRIASVPGLGGVSLRDWAAPGYAAPAPPDPSPPFWDPEYSRNETVRFGYTPEMRLAFLRKEGVDPLDLIAPSQYKIQQVTLSVPFFPDNDYAPALAPPPVYGAPNNRITVVDGEIQVVQQINGRAVGIPGVTKIFRQWDLFRAEKNAGLLSEVYASLRPKLPGVPGVPLYLQREGTAPYNDYDGYTGSRWFGSWDTAGDTKTPSMVDTSRSENTLQTARRLSKTVLQIIGIETDAAYARHRPSTIPLPPETPEQRAARWNGYRRSVTALFGTVSALSKSTLPPPATRVTTTPVRTPVRTRVKTVTPVKPATWDGFVLDLTGFPGNEIPAALGELLAETGDRE